MIKRKVREMYYLSGAAITVGIISGSSTAHAQGTGFNAVAETVAKGIEGLPGLITALSYLIGTLLAALGVMKIKDHVENPTQTPLKDGAIRLAVGGALFALPAILGAMQETADSGQAATIQGLNKASFTVN